MRPVVYLDVVLGVNLLMDCAILWAAARLGRIPFTGWRLVLGGAVGAAYATLLLLPPGGGALASLGVKIAFSLAMVLVAFYPLTWRRFWQACAYFYLVAMAMGGAVLAAVYLGGGQEVAAATLGGAAVLATGSLPYTWLAAGLAAALFLAHCGAAFIRKNLWQSSLRLPLCISLGGRQQAVKALLDTGNSLRDPLTGRPVVLVEYAAVQALLPAEVRRGFAGREEPDVQGILLALAATPWAGRFCLIPFTAIGVKSGMLLGVRPDEVVLPVEGRLVRTREVILGIYQRRLSPEGNYGALLHPDLLQAGP